MQLTLASALNRRGWTAQRLAQQSGLNKSTVSRLLRDHNVPNYATVTALEKALGLRRGTLVFGHSEPVSA